MKLLPSQCKFCVHHTTMHYVTSCKATYLRLLLSQFLHDIVIARFPPPPPPSFFLLDVICMEPNNCCWSSHFDFDAIQSDLSACGNEQTGRWCLALLERANQGSTGLQVHHWGLPDIFWYAYSNSAETKALPKTGPCLSGHLFLYVIIFWEVVLCYGVPLYRR